MCTHNIILNVRNYKIFIEPERKKGKSALTQTFFIFILNSIKLTVFLIIYLHKFLNFSYSQG